MTGRDRLNLIKSRVAAQRARDTEPMSAEWAATLVLVAQGYTNAGRRLPEHVLADMQSIVRSDLPEHVKNEARRLLENQ